MCTITMLGNIKIDINDRRVQLIIIGIIIIFFSIIIYFVLRATKKETPREYLLDTPYTIDTEHRVQIDNTLVEDLKIPKDMNVYVIENKVLDSEIDKFLIAIGKSGMKKENIQNVLVTWTQGDDYVEYVPNNQTVYFKFTKPATTKMTSVSGELGIGYLESIFKDYWGYNYTFIDQKVSRSGTLNRIEGFRSLNSYPIFKDNFNSYTDYVLVSNTGQLYEGTLFIGQFSTNDIQKVNIVSLDYMRAAINYAQYPKSVYYGFFPDISTDASKIVDEDHKEIDLVALLDTTKLNPNSKANNVRLGYIFRDTSYSHIVPTYRIQTDGSGIVEGKETKLPLVIFTNAMDPSRVYYPNE